MITRKMEKVHGKHSIIPRVCHANSLVSSHPRLPPPLEVPANDGIAGTSNDKGKSVTGNLPSSSSGDDDQKNANSDLLEAWMQRLQVLTILVRRRWCLFDRIYLYNITFKTAFLASMDGSLFSLTALNTQIEVSISTTAREVVYACLAGALTFHICASRCFSCCHPHYIQSMRSYTWLCCVVRTDPLPDHRR